jgi:transcription-repair coupling factor (superfamily II helicase)
MKEHMMQLTGLLDLLRDQSAAGRDAGRQPLLGDVLARLKSAGEPVAVPLIRAARPFVIAGLAREWSGPVIVLTARIKRAYNVTEQLPAWLGSGYPVLRYAESASDFYERVPWGEGVIRARLESLAALMSDEAGDPRPSPPVVVASARALMTRTLPVHQFRQASITLRPRARFALDKLLASFMAIGYDPAPIVVEPGTFSRRGGVIDIFPITAVRPVRIEFFDDEVESLRPFDPSTQRSATAVASLMVTPAREVLPANMPPVADHLAAWFTGLKPPEDDMTSPAADLEALRAGSTFPYLEHYAPYAHPRPISLLDYAPHGSAPHDDALIVIEDLDGLREAVEEIDTHAQAARAEQIEAGTIPDDYPRPYLDWAAIESALTDRRVLLLGQTAGETGAASPFLPGERFGGQLRPMLTRLREQKRKGARIVVISAQAARLADLWLEQDSSEYVPVAADLHHAPGPGTILTIDGTLAEGWSLAADDLTIHLLTDSEIFGWSRSEPRRSKSSKRGRPPEADYADWKPGDFVVHVDYGIGQFTGMRSRTVEGSEREYLVVQYEGTDMLFVPIHQADRLTKYIGADDSPPQLNKLGQQDWLRVRSRAAKAIQEEAEELLRLYSERMAAEGYAYAPDTHYQHELEAAFPFVETEDQLRAVREVKADMERSQPMDRLICGDVGYGKTEVALRAAFKAVMDSKQVAVLVPTTVLAQQHYDTFRRRLENFPVTVEMMSRFRTREEQNVIGAKLARGEVDIIIGTHRILSSDVQLKDLGLVIIDEEQRFGVRQKEHFKTLRTQVDVLTLTATPIPRTLYMGLTGVRDISMIQTPPEERLPVITHVGRWDDGLVRAAITRELERGGQVFVVHNRIRTIDLLREKLEELVPEARIVTGHGQMQERTLESVMAAFGRGEFDILLSTSIIENGIDIPNANTLIVDRADMFGLAQLYQLRGRVGRSAQQAFAYFFHAGSKRLTEEALARLDTLAENTGLGAGFQIAMRDLEIRGAGDILSTRQTGHVAAIGLNLYTQLLTQAIQQRKGREKEDAGPLTPAAGIVIDLPVPAYLPADWIPDMSLRLQIYRRIAGLATVAEIEAMRAELRDRFGLLPNAVEGLLYQIEVKLLAQDANATHILARDGALQIKLPYLAEINRAALENLLRANTDTPALAVSRTAVTLPQEESLWQLKLADVLRVLGEGYQASIRAGQGV